MNLLPTRRSSSVQRQAPAPRRRQEGFAWLTNPYRHGGAAFTVDAADFDGSDYLTRMSNLTSLGSSNSGILSLWLRSDAWNTSDGQTFIFNDFDANPAVDDWHFALFNDDASTNGVSALWTSGGGASQTAIDFSLALNTWHHILLAWELDASPIVQLYVNGSSTGSFSGGPTALTVPWANTDSWWIGTFRNGPFGNFNGGLAELYFAPGQYLDISVQANREKFRSAAGKPVSLGADGSTPTNTVPKIYLHLDDGEAAANFATNRSGNGDFTVTGSLTTYATSPAD